MRASSIIMGISISILLFSIGYIAVDSYTSNNTHSFASLNPVIRQVMVIDLEKIGVFTPELVATGQLPILAIHQSDNPQNHTKDLLTFLDYVGRLINFDVNNNNRLDTTSPIFSRLEVVYIQNQKAVRILPLAELGIRQIYLDRAHTQQKELFPGGPKGYWGVINIAILSDGSQREVRVVPMSGDYLP